MNKNSCSGARNTFYLCGFPSLLRAATASAPTGTQQWVRYQFPTIEPGVHTAKLQAARHAKAVLLP